MADMFSYFLGKDGFHWFIGVCEDRDDPETLGRVRCRVFGYHTDDLTKLPTQDLPWANVVLPPNAKPGFKYYADIFNFLSDMKILCISSESRFSLFTKEPISFPKVILRACHALSIYFDNSAVSTLVKKEGALIDLYKYSLNFNCSSKRLVSKIIVK